MEQVEQRNPKDSSLPSELRNADPDLVAAKETGNINCHWSISPAWCYAMATLDRLEQERLRRLKKLNVHRMPAAKRVGFICLLLSVVLLFLLSADPKVLA